MSDLCICERTFRGAEDYRDHLPCPGSRQAWLEKEYARIQAALQEMRVTYRLNKHAQEWADFIDEFEC